VSSFFSITLFHLKLRFVDLNLVGTGFLAVVIIPHISATQRRELEERRVYFRICMNTYTFGQAVFYEALARSRLYDR